MTENVDPENLAFGVQTRRNAMLKDGGGASNLAHPAKLKPANQDKRRVLGTINGNANAFTQDAVGKKNLQIKESTVATGVPDGIEFNGLTIKQEVKSENMECSLPADLPFSVPGRFESSVPIVKEEVLSDESMEVESVGDDNSFFTKETEYHVDYLRYLRNLETDKIYKSNPRYMSRQREIDFDMRATLVDWMVELREEFQLNCETLFLSVALLDRFLSVMSCSQSKLQLAGVTTFFIAAKFEEVYPPSAQELVHLTANTYTTRQLLKLEVSMLKVLKFQVATPTPITFLSIFLHSRSRDVDAQLRDGTPEPTHSQLEFLSKYICELTLLQGETFLQFLASEIAAAALYVAADTLNLHDWRKSVFRKSGHSVESLGTCIQFVHRFLSLAPRLQWPAIRDKYSTDGCLNVAKIRPRPTILVSEQEN